MNEIEELLGTLTEAQRQAVSMLKVFIDCYNSRDGAGLFAGVSRYSALEGRCALAAARATGLLEFWALLRRSLRLDIPARSADELITPLWQSYPPQPVLRCLAMESAEIIMIARMLCNVDKEAYLEAKASAGAAPAVITEAVAKKSKPRKVAPPEAHFDDFEMLALI